MALARLAAPLALLAAAGAVAAKEPSAPPAEALPRSSVAAVLAHRDELGLDAEQVRRLERIDDELQRRNAELGTSERRGPAERDGARSRSRWGAQPDGPRDREGMNPRRGGSEVAGAPDGRRAATHAAGDPQRARDDNDTAAYWRAEELLRPDQRERARDIAERYREELYDRRAAGRKAPQR